MGARRAIERLYVLPYENWNSTSPGRAGVPTETPRILYAEMPTSPCPVTLWFGEGAFPPRYTACRRGGSPVHPPLSLD